MSNLIPSIESFAKGTLATTVGVSTIGFGLLYYGQGFLIYPSAFPPGSRTEVAKPSEFDLPYEDLPLKTSDDVTLQCYLMRQKLFSDKDQLNEHSAFENDDEFSATRPTVIMFHGNAGNHGHRIPLAKVFFAKLRCNVLMMAYRGYALSEGSPSEKGLCLDAQAALDFIKADPHLSKTPTILYGQSIGGAVSIDLASRNPTAIDALILENTFLSLPRLIPHALPLLGPFSFLCHQKWDSASKMALIPPTMPILMLSGLKDEIVPPSHMRGLLELAAKRGEKVTKTGNGAVGGTEGGKVEYKKGLERVKFLDFETGQHNDTCTKPGYWSAIADFIASLGDVQPTPERNPTPPKKPVPSVL